MLTDAPCPYCALDKHNAAQGLSDDAAVSAKVNRVDKEVMVGIVFSWKDFKPKKVRMAENMHVERYDLRLRPGDTDSHTPLKMFFGDGKRDRTPISRAFRINSARIRERRRRACASSAAYDGDQGDFSDASVS